MTEEERSIVQKSDTLLRKLTLVYYSIVVVPLPFLFIIMLDNYMINDEMFEAFQQPIYEAELLRLWSVTFSVLIVELYLFKTYKRKLKLLRELPLEQAFLKYKTLNVYFYIALGICSYPFVFLFIDTLLYLYVGIYSLVVFILMALERPSAQRLIRNLKIKKPLSDRIKGIPEKEPEAA